MNKPTIEEIEQTIRAVAAAESPRYFKSEVNTPERSSWVLELILACVSLALFDLALFDPGGSTTEITYDIATIDIVAKQMRKDGYVWSGEVDV